MNDPLVDEIRRVRRQISDELGPNLDGLVDRYSSIENRFTKPPLTTKDRRTLHVTGVANSGALTLENPSLTTGDR